MRMAVRTVTIITIFIITSIPVVTLTGDLFVLTMLLGHIPPRCAQTRPGGEVQEWTSLVSNTQSCP